MTPTELDRMLAFKVIGVFRCTCKPNCPDLWLESPAQCLMQRWHPTTDIAQAMMVLEKTGEDYIIRKIGDEYYVAIGEQAISDTTPDKRIETAASLAAKAWLESQ